MYLPHRTKMFPQILFTSLLISATLSKEILIQNSGKRILTVSVSGHDDIQLLPHTLGSVILEDTWSGSISGCTGNCNGDVRTVAHLKLGSLMDQYDVSLVDGFNLPIKVVPIDGQKCNAAVCSKNINKICPITNRILDTLGQIIACRSSPLLFSKVCPKAVINNGEESIKSCSCNAAGYKIIFG